MLNAIVIGATGISPYISEGSGLKQRLALRRLPRRRISPYISEGSGLKQVLASHRDFSLQISPYISEGSGLKPIHARTQSLIASHLPLHQ